MNAETMICIKCPKGCSLEIASEEGNLQITGNLCTKGIDFAREEKLNPKRNIATSLPADGEIFHTLSVRLTDTIPRKYIESVIKEIHEKKITPPIGRGDVIICNIMNLGVDVIATRSIE